MEEEKPVIEEKAPASRRAFLRQSAVAVVAAGVASNVRAGYVDGSDTLRIGLVGCGGRGTGAAAQALRADPNTRLVAMADAFADQLDKSLVNLGQSGDVSNRVRVPKDHCFVGFDAYQQLLSSDVDVVLLATPTHFRPIHVRACLEAGKHVFAEKPVAVDAPGIRSILESAQLAKQKNLSLVSGLCWRYETGMQKTIRQIHQGALGDLVTIESTRFNGFSRTAPRSPGDTDMYWQMRNWYNFTWLSGDFIVEQFVHELDKIAWLMKDQNPIRCVATGGRQTRIGEANGNIYDHFSAVFEYENGVKHFAATRQQPRCSSEFIDLVFGTQGRANLMEYSITGQAPWQWPHERTDMHQLEHNAMYKALRKGEVINNGEYMAKSTLLGIMARMSAYTGKTLTWEEALNSQESLSPETYAWDAKPPASPVSMPGETLFV